MDSMKKMTLVIPGSGERATRIVYIPQLVLLLAAFCLLFTVAGGLLLVKLFSDNRHLNQAKLQLKSQLSSMNNEEMSAVEKQLRGELVAKEMTLKGEMQAREKILREEIEAREALIRSKDEELATQKQHLTRLDDQFSAVKNKLDGIREMDAKIRQYLGLEIEDPEPLKTDPPPNSHQGGMDPQSFSSLEYRDEPQNTDSRSSTYGKDPESLLRYTAYVGDLVRTTLDHFNNRKIRFDHVPSILPVKGGDLWLSSSFGWRADPFTGLRSFHNGLDIAGAVKEPIIAPADGKVIENGKDRYLGKVLRIDHGNGLVTIFGHLHDIAVKNGQKVKRGQVVAYLGNTGRSSGPHLHYSISKNDHYQDPMEFIWDYTVHGMSFAKYDTQ